MDDVDRISRSAAENPSPTVIVLQAPVQQAKRPSCFLIFIAVLLLVVSAGQLGVAGYVASQSPKLKYHYAFFGSGAVSFLTGILALFAGQDIGRRRGWMIAASAFAVAGIIACVITIPFGYGAVYNKDKDCLLPDCNIKPEFSGEISVKVSCEWQCFDNYEIIWDVMMGIAFACAFFQALLIITACCHCIVDCCSKKKLNNVSSIGVTSPSTVAYSRLEC